MENILKIIKWAEELLLSKGYTINNPPDHILTTPWSRVIRFLTSEGYFYLKQTVPTLSLEPVIIQTLHDTFRANVPILVSVNKDLNCFLMKDAGHSLRDSLKRHFEVDLLCEGIKKYTDIQSAAVVYVNIFIEIGVPDWRLEKLPDLYKQLIAQSDFLKEDGMTNDDLKILHELHPKLSTFCKLLSQYKIPETLDHCDFHENNILIENTNNSQNMTIIDWGETVITHPFFSLLRCLDQAVIHHKLTDTSSQYLELQEACLENWLEFEPKEKLIEAMLLAKKLWPIYSALGFYRLMISSNPEEFRAYYANRPARLTAYFKEFIKNII